jgi:uncharacterized membrane protein
MAAPPITGVEPREDTGSHRRPAPPVATPAPPPPGRLRRLSRDRARLAVWGLMGLYAAAFSWMSVQGYRGFSTGRFDLGNMVQAVWSTTQGRPLDTTDISGVQFSRLGAHVDPVLVLFAPLWMLWSSPEMLLVAQAVIVASGALPAFWLGRRWLRDDRLAVAGAAAYLLYPALGNATLFDFHPVTLAAPLLLYCIWAVEEARWVTLAVCATLAALCQEQVGLLLAALAVWAWFRHPAHRRAAVALGVGGLAWVAIAVGVIMPVFGIEATNAHIDRYSRLGDGPADIALTLVTRPWEVAEILVTPGRLGYLLGLLAPLLLLPLAALPLAAVALPQLLINLFASAGPAQTVEYHYGVLITPVFVAATLLGLANLRARGLDGRLGRLIRRSGVMAALLVAAVLATGIWQGPLPLWGWVPGGWGSQAQNALTIDVHARAVQKAVDMVPPGVPVSATNDAGSHLSARERVHLFPDLRDAAWALVSDGTRARVMARDRPTLRPFGFRARLRLLVTSRRWRLVFQEDGVRLYRRVVAPSAG